MCVLAAYTGIALICLISKIAQTKVIYRAILAMALLQFVLIILQVLNIDPFFHKIGHEGTSDVVGLLGSHNQLAAYYAATSVILMNFFAPLVGITVVVAYLTKCSSAAIASVVAIIFYALTFGKQYLGWVVALCIIVSCFFVVKSDSSASFALGERVKIWQLSIKQVISGKAAMKVSETVTKIVTCNPLTGFGLGSFIMISPSTQEKVMTFGGGTNVDKFNHRYEHAHNDVVEWFFEGGWIGFAILLLVLANILSNFIYTVKTKMLVVIFSSLVAQFVLSIGVYIVHAPVSYLMLCVMLGLFYAEVANARKII